MNIQLVNIDLSGVSIEKQIEKVAEEYIEFLLALADFKDNPTEENKEHMIEEYLDYIQAPLGILDKLGISAEEVQAYYPKHLEKLKDRPRIKNCDNCKNCRTEEKKYVNEVHSKKQYFCKANKDFHEAMKGNKKCESWCS